MGISELEIAPSISPRVTLHKLKYENVLYIAANMREADRKEITATRYDESPEAITEDCMNTGVFAWTIHKERPICAIGCFQIWPGVWHAWMYATDEFTKIRIFTTRFAKKIIIPTLEKYAHRAECHSVKGHKDAQKWLVSLGAKRETALKQYGKNKEDFYVYSWRK